MKRNFLFILIILFLNSLVYSQEEKIIGKIDFIGLKNTKKRVLNELPVSEGGLWNESTKKKLISFLQTLKDEKILTRGSEPKIEEISVQPNIVNLKITIDEGIPAFGFPLPGWSTSHGLKVVVNYWQFYVDGYLMPIKASLRFVQDDGGDFRLEYNDIPLTDDKRLTNTVHLKAYTSFLNYIIKDPIGHPLNGTWSNAIENFNLGFSYKIPVIEATINPSFGFDFLNPSINTEPSTQGDITKIINYKQNFNINPKLEFFSPIPETTMTIGARAGFGFKNIKTNDYLNASNNSNYLEYSFTCLDPGSLNGYPDPLYTDYLSKFYINSIILPYSNSSLSVSLGYGYKNGYYTDINYYGTKLTNYINGIKVMPAFNFSQPVPIINSNFNINFGLTYGSTWNSFGYDYAVGDYTNILTISTKADDPLNFPSILKFDFNIPGINATLSPRFGVGYKNTWFTKPENYSILDTSSDTVYNNSFVYNYSNMVVLSPAINFNIPLYTINSSMIFFTQFNYVNYWRSTYSGTIIDKYSDYSFKVQKLYIKELSFTFKKNITLDDYYLTIKKVSPNTRKIVNELNSFEAKTSIYYSDAKPLFATNYVNANGAFYPENFMVALNLFYQLYLPIYKENIFKMRLDFFCVYNDSKDYKKSKLDGGSINYDSDEKNYIDYWFREDRSNLFTYFAGFIGGLTNFEFKTLLFTFNTPKFGTFPVGKDLIWDLYWSIYMDVGLALDRGVVFKDSNTNVISLTKQDRPDYQRTYSYSVDYNNLHLVPSITIGTNFKIMPRFAPIMAILEASVNIDGKIVNDKLSGIFSSIFFSISFQKVDETVNWFTK